MADYINVKDFGAKGDGHTDDTDAIQDAINSVGENGNIVFIPTGQYNISGIQLKTGVQLIGAGWSSQLWMKYNSDANMIELANLNVERTRVANLYINGSKAHQSSGNAIYYNNTGGTHTWGAPIHILENIFIRNAKDSGIKFEAGVQETRLANIYIGNTGWNGFSLKGADNHLDRCTAASSGEHGFYLYSPNTRSVECKAFGSAKDNFHITGSPRQQLIGCESQDAGRHGFNIYGVDFNMLEGCYSHRDASIPLRLDNADYNKISGVALKDSASGDISIELTSGSHDNQIHAIADKGVLDNSGEDNAIFINAG